MSKQLVILCSLSLMCQPHLLRYCYHVTAEDQSSNAEAYGLDASYVSTTAQHLLMSQVLASAATVGVTVVHGCTSCWSSRQSNGKTLPVGLFMEALLERTVKFI